MQRRPSGATPSPFEKPEPSPVATRLAAALASRLDDVVPDGIRVTASVGIVTVEDASSWVKTSLEDTLSDQEDGLRWTCHRVLDHVQDFVAETTGEPWPARAHTLPLPVVRMIGGRIELRYGTELTLPTIERAELGADQLARRMINASPWPPPPHRAATPRSTPRRRIS